MGVYGQGELTLSVVLFMVIVIVVVVERPRHPVGTVVGQDRKVDRKGRLAGLQTKIPIARFLSERDRFLSRSLFLSCVLHVAPCSQRDTPALTVPNPDRYVCGFNSQFSTRRIARAFVRVARTARFGGRFEHA